MKHKGKVRIGDNTYPVEVKDGVRFVNGMTVDEFCKTLTPEQMRQAARVGKMALWDEIQHIKPPKGKYQYYMNEPL